MGLLTFDFNDPSLNDHLSLHPKAIFACPTDTQIGLSTRLSNLKGIDNIMELKGREGKHFICLTQSLESAEEYVTILPSHLPLLKSFWPGPHSFIFKAKKGPWPTLALRVPRHEGLHALLTFLGEPIVSTSANLSGKDPVEDTKQLQSLFGDKLDFIIEGRGLGAASTLVDLTSLKPQVLRGNFSLGG